MRAVFRLLIIGWLVHSACATSLAAASSLAEPAPLTLSIGISAETANNLPEDLLEKTISSISADLPETSIKIITLSERELHQKISGREVELFISSAEFFRQNKMQGVRDIAALISKQAPDPNHVDGSVILVDTQRVGLQHLEQLNGKTLLVNPAFGSSYLHYLFGEDESPKIGRIVEKRTSIPQLIDALLLGQADALVLPACKLEELAEISALNTSRLRVLDSKQYPQLHCFNSTSLYPGTTIAITPAAPSGIIRPITSAVLAMTPTSNGLLWSVASNYSRIDALLKKLDLDENAELRRWSLPRLWNEYLSWFIVAILSLLGLCLHSFVVSYLVRHRTQELSDALNRQRELEMETRSASTRLEKLQRIGIINQMGSIFAHEIRQPLSAIGCFAYSHRRLIERRGSRQDMLEAIEAIEKETDRSEAIVERIRTYVREHKRRLKSCPWDILIDDAIASFKTSSRIPIPVRWINKTDGRVLTDPFEMELVIVNLLRNSAQAQSSIDQPEIQLDLTQKEPSLCLVITDNGPKLPKEALQELVGNFGSGKPQGFGMGLMVVQSIIESQNGTMTLSSSRLGGLAVTIELPEVTDESLD